MQIQEFKNRAKVTFKNNSSKFIQVVLLHALLLSIVPLHFFIFIANVNNMDNFSSGFIMFLIIFFVVPIMYLIIPNFNPCMIRSFKGTFYEIRNNSTTKSYKYITNIFKYYKKYFLLASESNIRWYLFMGILVFIFSFCIIGPLLNNPNISNPNMIYLIVYSPIAIIYIVKNIYTLNYCFSTYIIYDNSLIQPPQALKQSKELLKGNFKNLLYLKFSFAGWYLLLAAFVIPLWIINLKPLSIILFFIGFELINAYQILAIIEMYNELKSKKINLNNQLNSNNQIYSSNQINQNYQNYMNNSNYQSNQNYINNSNNQNNLSNN